MEVTFLVTVDVPDDKLDADGRIVGSEEWTLREREDFMMKSKVPEWPQGEREPGEHFARRMLHAYCPAERVRVSDIKLKRKGTR